MSAALVTAPDFEHRLAAAPLYDMLRLALETFGDRVRVACSFGVEDMVIDRKSVV